MTRSSRALFSLVSLLLLLAAGAVWWLRGDDLELRSNDHPGAASSDAAAVAPAEAAGAERAAVARAARGAPRAGPPESFQRALGAFRGRLLEPDLTPAIGLPVAAVEFEVSRFLLDAEVLLDAAHGPPSLQSARSVSAEDGTFHLAGLEPRALHLLGIDLGGPRSAFRVIDVSPVSGETTDLGDIVLEPFVTFVGRVIDEDERPVPGARVRATNLPAIVFQFGIEDVRRGCGVMVEVLESPKAFEIPPIVWEFEKLVPIPTTLTDEEGRFRLPGVPLGMVTVAADKAGFRAATRTTPSGKGPERSVSDLVLAAGFELAGVVVSGAETPVAGIEVLAGIRSPAIPLPVALLQPAGRTDEKGRFAVGGLPPGSDAYVATRASRGQPWNVHGPYATDSGGLRVQLRPPSGLLVRMRDEGGALVEEAELFIAPDPIEEGAPLPPILAPPMQRLTEVATIEPGLARITGLDAGKYRLIGRARGFALAQLQIEVVEPPREFELLFQRAHVVEVTVVRGRDAQPLEWAFASLCPEGIFERPIARGRTDEEGRVALARVPAGKYLLTVQHPAQATQELPVVVPSPPLTVALPLGGSLKGRAHDRGADPGKSLFVILTRKDPPRPDAGMPTFSATAETGHFFVPNLEAGSYRHELRDRIVGKGPLALFETLRDDPLARGEFEIREGETTEIEVDVSGAADGPVAELHGSVWINGVPTGDLSIRVEGRRKVTVKSDERGDWRFETVPAGKSVLTVQGLKEGGDLLQFGAVMHREELELAAGESRRIDLNLAVAAVRGRVRGPGPLPAGLGTMVILRSPAGAGGQFTTTNPLTGSFEFAHVPRGEYDLLVRRSGAAPFTTSIVVEPSHGDVECNAELTASVAARGRVVLPEGEAAPTEDEAQGRVGGFLTLIDGEGRPAGRGRIDWKTAEFVVDDCAAGEYTAQLFLRRDRGLVARRVVIPAAGASDLVLRFEPPREGEALVNPFGAGGRPAGPPRGN